MFSFGKDRHRRAAQKRLTVLQFYGGALGGGQELFKKGSACEGFRMAAIDAKNSLKSKRFVAG